MENQCSGFNERTGDTIEITFTGKGWRSDSSIAGVCKDKTGKVIYEVSGFWNEEIFITDSKGVKLSLYKPPLFPEDAKRQYFFTDFVKQLNYVSEDMKQSGYLPPTDSRLRGDQRLFEEGKWNEADDEKCRLEEKQRKHRKEKEAAKQEHIPLFFNVVQEMNPFTKEMETNYKLKEGQDNYWLRR